MINYILFISAVLNAALIIAVLGAIPFFLYMSVVINLLLTWYIYKCIDKLDDVQDDLFSVLNDVEEFADHLESIHELEMFYGDETLQGLINHSKELINEIIDMQEKYYDPEIISGEEHAEQTEETAPEED